MEVGSFASDIAMSNKFPGKLWRIVNSCQTGAIGWGQGGHTIIIHQTKFQTEYLDQANCLFKTNHIGSFIRQLNLYGFRKLNALRYSDNSTELREVHEFQNDFFVRGRPDLLPRLRRNVGIRRSREMAVKRRLEVLQHYPGHTTEKQARYDCKLMQENYNNNSSATNQSVDGSGAEPSKSSSQNGQWPVYVQWDGQSYKYVVLPEQPYPSAAAEATPPPTGHPGYQDHMYMANQPQQPDQDTKPPGLQVIHLPNPDGSGVPQEYFVLGLVSQDELPDAQSSTVPYPDQREHPGCFKPISLFCNEPNPVCSSNGSSSSSSLSPAWSPCNLGEDDASTSLPSIDDVSNILRAVAISTKLNSSGDSDDSSLQEDSLLQDTSMYQYSGLVNDMPDKSEMDVYIRGGCSTDNDINVPFNSPCSVKSEPGFEYTSPNHLAQLAREWKTGDSPSSSPLEYASEKAECSGYASDMELMVRRLDNSSVAF